MAGEVVGVLIDGVGDVVTLLEESFLSQVLMMLLIRKGDGFVFDIETNRCQFGQSTVWMKRSLTMSFPESGIVGKRMCRFRIVFEINGRIGRRRRSRADEDVRYERGWGSR